MFHHRKGANARKIENYLFQFLLIAIIALEFYLSHFIDYNIVFTIKYIHRITFIIFTKDSKAVRHTKVKKKGEAP